MKRAFALVLLVALGCGEEIVRNVDPDIRLAHDALDFGGIPVLNESVVELVVDNLGGAPLTLADVRIREHGAPFFVKEAPERVEGGGQVAILVAFVPPSTDKFEGTLLVDSDDPDSPFLEVRLAGEGTTVAQIAVEPMAIDFGRVGEGNTALRTVKIQSLGTADLIVQKVAFEEGTAPGYGLIGSTKTPAVLAGPRDGFPGERIELNVKFSPAEGATQTTGALIIGSTDPRAREVRVALTAAINRAPIADAKLVRPGDATVPLLTSIPLDGSASYDPDSGLPVTYTWRIVTRPFGSQASIDAPAGAAPNFLVDIAGTYEVELMVADNEGLLSLRPSRLVVRAVPPDSLTVTLVWQNDRTDLDLHFRPASAGRTTSLDCYWANREPDLGVLGDPSDDPFLRNDDLSGFGPEVMAYTSPVEDTYVIEARLRSFNGALVPQSPATVRVFVYGELAAELKKTLQKTNEWWTVGTVKWPSGEVTPAP